jgi:hypothetical protein
MRAQSLCCSARGASPYGREHPTRRSVRREGAIVEKCIMMKAQLAGWTCICAVLTDCAACCAGAHVFGLLRVPGGIYKHCAFAACHVAAKNRCHATL